MPSLREQVDAILGSKPIISGDNSVGIHGGSGITTESNGSSPQRNEISHPADSTNTGGPESYDPASASADADESRPRSRSSNRSSSRSDTGSSRTRASSRAKNEEVSFDLGDLYFILNNLMAYSIDCSELEITPKQADAMGSALNRLMRHSKTTKLTPSQLAWLNLVGTTLVVYGPPLWKISERKKQERKSKIVNISQRKQDLDDNPR